MTKGPGILFVDDEASILRALERVFLEDDYEVMTACSGEEGLALLCREPDVRVVVSDYRMPGMDGIAFLRAVGERWPDTVRLVLSGYSDTGALASAINEGKIARFIAKPWQSEELRQAVSDALRQHRRNVRIRERKRDLNHVMNILEQLPFGVIAATADGSVWFKNRAAAVLRLSGGAAKVREFRIVCHEQEETLFLLYPTAGGGDPLPIFVDDVIGSPGVPIPAKPVILCVDDEPEILRVMAMILEDDCELLTARLGKEGLETLERSPAIRVVLSDYRMPGMDGVEFLRQVGDRWPDKVRIVVSGHADAASVVAAINEGRISRFIAKPWDPDTLKAAIGEALARYDRDMGDRGLKEQLGRMLEILAQLPVGILAAGGNGGLLYSNRTADALLGRNGREDPCDPETAMVPRPLAELLARSSDAPEVSGPVLLRGREILASCYRVLHQGRQEVLFILEGRGDV